MKSNINNIPLRTWSSIEEYWERKNIYNLRPRTMHYPSLPDAEHFADGWRDVIAPTLTDTQKRGGLIYDAANEVVTWEVTELTPEEIAIKEQQAEDSDRSAQEFNRVKSDGNEFFDKFLIYIQRQLDKGNITGNQALQSFNLLYLPLLPLKDGMFRISQANLNQIPAQANQKVQAIIDLAKEKVTQYLSK